MLVVFPRKGKMIHRAELEDFTAMLAGKAAYVL